MPGTAWVVIGLVWAEMVLRAVVLFAVGTMLPSMREALQFGSAKAGYLSAVGWLATSLLTIPLTFIVTKVRPKLVLMVVFFVLAVALFLQGMAPNYTVLFLARAVGIGAAIAVMPALVLLKQQWIPLTHLSMINGFEAFTNPVGQILGTALVPFLLVWLAGWRLIFYILGTVGLVLAVLWILFGRERQNEAFEQAWEDKTVSPLHDALREKTIWLLALGWPGTTLVWSAILTFWPTLAVTKLGLPMTQAGLILSALPVGSMTASLIAPWITNKVGYDKPMIWSWGFILPLAYFALLQTPNVALLIVASFVAGFGNFAFVPVAFTLLYKIPGINPKVVAMGTGIIITIATLGATAGNVIVGTLAERLGDLHTAIAVCCISPITMGICGLFLPELGRKAMEKKATAEAAD